MKRFDQNSHIRISASLGVVICSSRTKPTIRHARRFGPSELTDQANFGESHMIAHSFLADSPAVEPLVPCYFRLAEPVKISVIGGLHLRCGFAWAAAVT